MKSGTLCKVLSVAMLLGGSGLVSCDRSPARRTTIAVVPKVDDASVAAAKAAALAARDAYGIAVRWDVSRSATAKSQAELVGKLVEAGVDGLLLNCIDASNAELNEAIDRAVAKGVAVGTFDSDAPLSGRSFYIGSDNTAAGRLAAETLRALCAAGGRPAEGIGVVEAWAGDAAMEARLAALVQEVPDTAAVLGGDGAAEAALRMQVGTFLTEQAQRPVNGMVFLSSVSVIDGPGAIARLDSLCREAEGGVLFFDPSEALLEFVAEIPHGAAIRQDFEAMVSGGIERLLRVIRGEPFGETVTYTPVGVVR
ncbi:MAG: substrate-binding domain-containing protein [Rikenella sp.]|nr:substrate-binding domain-containing protein [Rikenella sp.]